MHVSTAPARLGSVLTAIVGIGGLGFAALLLAMARSGMGGSLPGFGSILALVAATSALYGVIAMTAAVGLWNGAAWAVALGYVVHGLGLAGVLVAAETSGVEGHIVAGTFLTVAGLMTLTPSLRPSTSGRVAPA